MPRMNVKVRVDRAIMSTLSDFSARAQCCGFETRREIEELDLVFGSIEESRIAELRAVEGAAQVEPEDTLHARK